MIINRTRVDSFALVVIFSIFVTVGSSSVFATNDCMDSRRVKTTIHIQVDDRQKPYFHDHACSLKPVGKRGYLC